MPSSRYPSRSPSAHRAPSPSDERRRSSTRMPHNPQSGDNYASSDDSSGRRVRFPNDPDSDYYSDRDHRHSQHQSRSRSHSRSRSRSRSHRHHRRPSLPNPLLLDEGKPWFKKKTLWTTVASLATVVALVPTTIAANASLASAGAATQGAKNSKRAADAAQIASKASVASARSAHNSSVAQGHQDVYGRYTGPREHLRHEALAATDAPPGNARTGQRFLEHARAGSGSGSVGKGSGSGSGSVRRGSRSVGHPGRDRRRQIAW